MHEKKITKYQGCIIVDIPSEETSKNNCDFFDKRCCPKYPDNHLYGYYGYYDYYDSCMGLGSSEW